MLGNFPDFDVENSPEGGGIPQKRVEFSPCKCGIFYLDKTQNLCSAQVYGIIQIQTKNVIYV
jgi:hypothetical protein